MSAFYSVAALVTTVLNSLVLISIWKTPSLHKPSYILIASLALSDLLVGAIGEPLRVIENIAVVRRWSLDVYCIVFKCTRGVTYSLGAISLFTLTSISLDRLLAVKLRNRYQTFLTQKRVFCVLLPFWILTCVCSSTVMGTLNLNTANLTALLLFVGILVFIPIVTITICYSMAFYSLRKITSSSVSPSVQNAEAVARPSSNIDVAKYRKSLITMIAVFIFTLLFYSPIVIVLITAFVLRTENISPEASTSNIILICVGAAEFISLLNSTVNPLLYMWRMRDLREAVKTTVKRAFKVL